MKYYKLKYFFHLKELIDAKKWKLSNHKELKQISCKTKNLLEKISRKRSIEETLSDETDVSDDLSQTASNKNSSSC